MRTTLVVTALLIKFVMKYHIYILYILVVLFFWGCKEKKEEYDFSNKYFELEPQEKVKMDPFGFNLSQPIKGVAFYDNKIFINTHNKDGIELVNANKKEKLEGRRYEFSGSGEKITIFVLPDSTGLVIYNGMYYDILKIRDAAERKKEALPSYNQIEEYINNGCVTGKVKKTILSQYETKIAFEKYVKEKVAEEICHYDTSGQLVNQMVYEISPKDGEKIPNTEYLYQYKGDNKVYYKCKSYKKYGKRAFFECLDFDEEGRVHYDEIIYKYNKQNQLAAIQQNGEYKKMKQEYFYSEDSLLVEIKTYDFSHKLINVTKVKRKKGGGTQLFKYSEEGERKRVLTYDNKGYLISNIPYSNAKESYWGLRQEIEYSSNMVILKNLRRESGGGYREHIEKDILSFDTYGNILKRFSTYRREPFKSRPDLEVYETEDEETFSYIYDERGNWIRLKVVDSKKEYPVIIERDIEYY